MVKITKGEHGLLADGKPIDESSFAELSDEDLEQTSGGITVIQHFDGSSVDKLRCWQCAAKIGISSAGVPITNSGRAARNADGKTSPSSTRPFARHLYVGFSKRRRTR